MTIPPDVLLAATPADVEQGIRRELFKHPKGLTEDGLLSAIMTVVGPVLEAKDAEAARQTAQRRRVVLWLTKLAVDYRELASNGPHLNQHTTGSLAYRSVAHELIQVLHGLLEVTADELGPYRDELDPSAVSIEAITHPVVEIAALRAELETVRADERANLAIWLRSRGLLGAANEIDPLGPLQGARAIGGTE